MEKRIKTKENDASKGVKFPNEKRVDHFYQERILKRGAEVRLMAEARDDLDTPMREALRQLTINIEKRTNKAKHAYRGTYYRRFTPEPDDHVTRTKALESLKKGISQIKDIYDILNVKNIGKYLNVFVFDEYIHDVKMAVMARDDLDTPMREALRQLLTTREERANKNRQTLLPGSDSGSTLEPRDHVTPKPDDEAKAVAGLERGISHLQKIYDLLEDKRSCKDIYIYVFEKYLDEATKQDISRTEGKAKKPLGHYDSILREQGANARKMVMTHNDLNEPMREALRQLITIREEQANQIRQTYFRGLHLGPIGRPLKAKADAFLERSTSQLQKIHHLLEEKRSCKDICMHVFEKYLDDQEAQRSEASPSDQEAQRSEAFPDFLRRWNNTIERLGKEKEDKFAREKARKILQCLKELQTCERSQLPEVLANFIRADHAFPIDDMRDFVPVKQKLIRFTKIAIGGKCPLKFCQYIVKDLENDGPVAKLAAHAQKFRKARGGTSVITLTELLKIYHGEYQNISGADKSHKDMNQDLSGFLQAVGALDSKRRKGTIKDELLLTAVPIITGIRRALYREDLPGILDECGFPENGGTLFGLCDPGMDTLSVQKDLMRKGKAFSGVYTFDICTEEQALNPAILMLPPGVRIPIDQYKEKLAQIKRHYECDLTKVKLTEKLDPHTLPSDKPILYDINNVFSYLDEKALKSMLERIRDIPEALGREPASLLHMSYGLSDNPPIMQGLLIDLTTGHLLRIDNPEFNLRGSNVRGPKDLPFQIEEEKLSLMIKAERRRVKLSLEKFPLMSDREFERLCKEHKLVVGLDEEDDPGSHESVRAETL